jgi:hypothetical protein
MHEDGVYLNEQNNATRMGMGEILNYIPLHSFLLSFAIITHVCVQLNSHCNSNKFTMRKEVLSAIFVRNLAIPLTSMSHVGLNK